MAKLFEYFINYKDKECLTQKVINVTQNSEVMPGKSTNNSAQNLIGFGARIPKLRDYVEMIAELIAETGEARSVDLAARFGVTGQQ